MAKYSKEREHEVRTKVAELEKSGESVAAFARRHGVSAWTVYTWRKRFGSGRVQQSKTSSSKLVPVEVVDTDSGHTPIEIVIRDVSIRVTTGFDERDLTRLLRVIRSC